MTTSDLTFEEVLGLVKQLTPVQKLHLIEAIVPDLVEPLNQVHEEQRPLRSLYRLWKDLNFDISAEDIDEARREMWGLFPREDV